MSYHGSMSPGSMSPSPGPMSPSPGPMSPASTQVTGNTADVDTAYASDLDSGDEVQIRSVSSMGANAAQQQQQQQQQRQQQVQQLQQARPNGSGMLGGSGAPSSAAAVNVARPVVHPGAKSSGGATNLLASASNAATASAAAAQPASAAPARPAAHASHAASAAAAARKPQLSYGFTGEQRRAIECQIKWLKDRSQPVVAAEMKPKPLPPAVSPAQGHANVQYHHWLAARNAAMELARHAKPNAALAAAQAAQAQQHAAAQAAHAAAAAQVAKAQQQQAAANKAAAAAKKQAMARPKRPATTKVTQEQRKRERAEAAARDAARAEALRTFGPVLRTWPHALYHFDYTNRDDPPVQFDVNSFSLPALLTHERDRLFAMSKANIVNRCQKMLESKDLKGSRRIGLQIQLRKCGLLDLQRSLRARIEAAQNQLVALNDRDYKRTQRDLRKNMIEMDREFYEQTYQLLQTRLADIKDVRNAMQAKVKHMNEVKLHMHRGVNHWHTKQRREHQQRMGDDREMRMQALKANDLKAYQTMLMSNAAANIGADERYQAIASFLTETEEYLNALTQRIFQKKLDEERERAFMAALAEGRAAGMSEEVAKESALQAANDAMESSEVLKLNEEHAGDAQARYRALAHAVEEDVAQPSMLHGPGGARLREYQHVGLRWMVSLYNNNLNGILADEMGLGKTVQVMALIAYLMERKNNCGPHLIVVPNAVLVNWKSELAIWLPDVRCVYYTGKPNDRKALFKSEVETVQFNVLVTTYEFVMFDKTDLSKVRWKYLVIDEAQRMKNRESKLAKALDRFMFERRLLLTGTPLQNELKELWSLLNLLLPELFNDKAQFSKWFGDALDKNESKGGDEDELIDNEHRVVVINRLHQILEPFMLRRQVQDVEGSLPEKITLTIKVPFTGYQGAIYDWVNATGMLRVSPDSQHAIKTGIEYSPLKNRYMELRKVCNHPMLTYPPDDWDWNHLKSWPADERIVAQCGKMQYLDRLFVKLKRTGHRVLLFSTMTRLLDLLESYLKWRKIDGELLEYRRIDGSTQIDDRESAIKAFNSPGTNIFIFLLSIRAAGRGLNLQTADTVIIFDPDPNPKNEEQAVARSHRIGQKKTVRVIHFESVVDAPPGAVEGEEDMDAAAAAAAATAAAASTIKGISAVAAAASDVRRNTAKYCDSIESVYRHVLQKQKNDMAAEIIDAGRFDQMTTDAQRKQSLEQIMADETRNLIAKNEVPTWDDIHKQLARSPAELEEFEKIEAEEAWVPSTALENAPPWIRFTAAQVQAAVPSRKRRRNELEPIQTWGPGGRETPTVDASGRRVRKAATAATQAIADHAHWVHHNPYRITAAADGKGDEGGGDDDDEEGGKGKIANGAVNGAGPSAIENGNDDDARPLKRERGDSAAAGTVSGASKRKVSSRGGGDDEDEEATQSMGDDDDMEEEKDDGDNLLV